MKSRFGISGSELKWIAVITMVIDHFGACILENSVLNVHGNSPLAGVFSEQWDAIYSFDRILRCVGRVAFPLFCFLLVEGFFHTRDVKRYALRLGLFALISEIPFDLAVRGVPFAWSYQNVYFTLLIGLLTIWFMEEKKKQWWLRMAGFFIGCGAAYLLHTDYDVFGVALIALLYLLREQRLVQSVGGALVCLGEEWPAIFAFVLTYFYDGRRGRQSKWFFYWFYPAHLLLYYLIGAYLLPGIWLA
ncbi:MAG: conjugal transfer protein TraX [Lachnospiraceae bacterium]|nr:conjugal transfer protein TraX [Lachnospiraceae bacterium]